MFSFQIWVEIPESELQTNQSLQDSTTRYVSSIHSFSEFMAQNDMDHIREYGSRENSEELKRDLNKLILSVEMDNWVKAEGFAATVRELTMDAPQEVKSSVLRLKMAIQKQNYDTVNTYYQALKDILKN